MVYQKRFTDGHQLPRISRALYTPLLKSFTYLYYSVKSAGQHYKQFPADAWENQLVHPELQRDKWHRMLARKKRKKTIQ